METRLQMAHAAKLDSVRVHVWMVNAYSVLNKWPSMRVSFFIIMWACCICVAEGSLKCIWGLLSVLLWYETVLWFLLPEAVSDVTHWVNRRLLQKTQTQLHLPHFVFLFSGRHTGANIDRCILRTKNTQERERPANVFFYTFSTKLLNHSTNFFVQFMKTGGNVFHGCMNKFLGSSGHPQGLFNSLSWNEDKRLSLIVASKDREGAKVCFLAADQTSATQPFIRLWTRLHTHVTFVEIGFWGGLGFHRNIYIYIYQTHFIQFFWAILTMQAKATHVGFFAYSL